MAFRFHPHCELLESRLTPAFALDPTFSGDGIATSLDPNRVPFSGVAFAADGRIVTSGTEGVRDEFQGKLFLLAVNRYLSNGDPDPSFAGDGSQTISFRDPMDNYEGLQGSVPGRVAVQPDGKIVVASSMILGNKVGDSFSLARKVIGVARLNADGLLDTTFGTNGRAFIDYPDPAKNYYTTDNPEQLDTLRVLPDGRIVIGAALDYNAKVPAEVMFKSDPTFGGFVPYRDYTLTRLTAAGQLDGSYGAGGKLLLPIESAVWREHFAAYQQVNYQADLDGFRVAIADDGTAVVAGTTTWDAINRFGNGTPDQDSRLMSDFVSVARIRPDGTMDTIFDGDGISSFEFTPASKGGQRPVSLTPSGVSIRPGNVVQVTGSLFGTFGGSGLGVARLTAAGQLDTSFDDDGKLARLGGTATSGYGRIGRTSFNLDQLDGSTFVFGLYAGPRIARVLADGTPDDGFGDGGVLIVTGTEGVAPPQTFSSSGPTTTTLTVRSVAASSNGRIAVAGGYSVTNAQGTNVLVVLADLPPVPPVSPPISPPASPPTPPPASPPTPPPASPPTPPEPPTTVPPVAVPPVSPPASPPPAATSTAVGGTGGSLRVVAPDGTVLFTLNPFPGFAGTVRTTIGANGGIVAGTGPGAATRVVMLDPGTGKASLDFQPFEAAFTGGVFVSTGDLFGTGTPDIVTTPDQGGGPRVQIRDGKTGQVRADFFGIADPHFFGGARTAVADMTGDGVPDLIVAAGFGGGPRVTVFDGAALRAGRQTVIANVFVFEPSLRNGVYVAAGDLDGDGTADLIVGGGPGGGPRVLALSGKDLVAGTANPAVLANFFAGDEANRGGVRVAAKNLDGDRLADLVVGPGVGGGSKVTAFAGKSVRPSGTPPTLFSYDDPDAGTAGVFVG